MYVNDKTHITYVMCVTSHMLYAMSYIMTHHDTAYGHFYLKYDVFLNITKLFVCLNLT